jgi:DNA-binding transcriptional LysR family regulator
MHQLYTTFVQIVESDTLVKAAEILHLTQPTVTRQLQQLEQQLGMPLFDRIGKRLTLNHAGELVYRYAKSYIALKEKMDDELNEFSDPEVGHVYIGAGLTPSIYLLPPVFATYRRLHPRVQFQMRTGSSSEVLAALRQREIDMGVVTTVEQDDDLVLSPLFRDDLLLVAPPNSVMSQKRQVSLQELEAYPFVLMKQGSGLRKMIERLTKRHHLNIQVAMETDSLESINRLVQHGVGVGVLPRSSVQDDIQAGRLAVVDLADYRLAARTITLVTRSDSVLPASATQFAGQLPDLMGSISEKMTLL